MKPQSLLHCPPRPKEPCRYGGLVKRALSKESADIKREYERKNAGLGFNAKALDAGISRLPTSADVVAGHGEEISEIINNENLLRNYLSRFFLFSHSLLTQFHVPNPPTRPSSILIEYSLSRSACCSRAFQQSFSSHQAISFSTRASLPHCSSQP